MDSILSTTYTDLPVSVVVEHEKNTLWNRGSESGKSQAPKVQQPPSEKQEDSRQMNPMSTTLDRPVPGGDEEEDGPSREKNPEPRITQQRIRKNSPPPPVLQGEASVDSVPNPLVIIPRNVHQQLLVDESCLLYTSPSPRD